ncbi:MAG: TAXI family TRAP transporter solute-binding subunit [Synergistaceae bacterium]|jgi:TRAP transporter TAXI family solute receptor|nr:TAXI family TRAP transporter solute-binding subunit [Synergistaceae bacterium]
MRLNAKKFIGIVMVMALLSLSATAFAATKQLTIGTASPTGGWMMLASTAAKLINENVPGTNLTPVPSPRGGVENIETILSGEREMGLVMANSAFAAIRGEAPFTEPAKGLAGWFSAHYGYWYLLVREDSGIESFADLKGKRIAIGNPGDGDEALNRDVFKLLGLAWEDFSPEYAGLSGAVDLIKQNQIHALAYVGAPKLPSLNELLVTKKMRLLTFTDEELEKITEALPYLVVREMPQSDFPEMILPSDPAKVLSMNHVVVCSDKIPADDMYAYTKAVFSNLDEIHAASKAFSVITLESAVSGMPVPFHEGAARYFKEAGVLK